MGVIVCCIIIFILFKIFSKRLDKAVSSPSEQLIDEKTPFLTFHAHQTDRDFKKVSEVKSKEVVFYTNSERFGNLKIYVAVDYKNQRWCNIVGRDAVEAFSSPKFEWSPFCSKMLRILAKSYSNHNMYIIHQSLDNCPVPNYSNNHRFSNTSIPTPEKTALAPFPKNLFKKVKEIKSRGIIVFTKGEKLIGRKVYTVIDCHLHQ